MATIEKLTRKKGIVYRVQIRRKGHKPVTGSFRTKKDAEIFIRKVEGDIHKYSRLLGGELKKHTLKELIDVYANNYEGKDPSGLNRLVWWRNKYGDYLLSDFSNDVVKEDFSNDVVKDGLSYLSTANAKHGGGKITETSRKRSKSTINRYMAAISVVYKYAPRG